MLRLYDVTIYLRDDEDGKIVHKMYAQNAEQAWELAQKGYEGNPKGWGKNVKITIGVNMVEKLQIVCAAIKHIETGVIICGVRHFDMIMHNVAEKAFPDYRGHHFEQGFVDNLYNFHDRDEALKIALESGQPFREKPQHKGLFSEDLY